MMILIDFEWAYSKQCKMKWNYRKYWRCWLIIIGCDWICGVNGIKISSARFASSVNLRCGQNEWDVHVEILQRRFLHSMNREKKSCFFNEMPFNLLYTCTPKSMQIVKNLIDKSMLSNYKNKFLFKWQRNMKNKEWWIKLIGLNLMNKMYDRFGVYICVFVNLAWWTTLSKVRSHSFNFFVFLFNQEKKNTSFSFK